MKFIAICLTLVVYTSAQRPSYAGTGPIGRPGLASRFKDTTEPTTTVDVGSRVGEAAASTEKIPVDARGDYDLVNRINEWPREHRPFWILNAEHIEAQRNPQVQPQDGQVENRNTFVGGDTVQTIRPQVPPRSSFLGPRKLEFEER